MQFEYWGAWVHKKVGTRYALEAVECEQVDLPLRASLNTVN